MKKLLTIMMIMIISLIGITSVNAEEINYTGQFRLQFYSLSTGTTALTNVGNFNTAQQLSAGYGVSKIIPRYYGITFKKDTKYRVTTIAGFAPVDITESFTAIDSIGCFGTLSTNNWSADSSLIKNCEIVNIERVPNQNRVKYTVDIIPKRDIPGIQFNINTSLTEEVRVVNVYNASSITVTENIIGAIEDQTIIIQNTIEDSIQDLIDSTHEYEEEDISDQVDDLHETEQTILQNIDIDNLIRIQLNTNTRNFIWNTINTIIMYNTWFEALVIGLLSIGLCKLLLNR